MKIISSIGRPFTSLVLEGYQRNAVSSADVVDYLGVQLKHLQKLANQLLQQATPTRKDLLEPLESAETGEVHFIQKKTQAEEFAYVLGSVAQRIRAGVKPIDIIQA